MRTRTLTLAIERRPGEVAVRDVDGSREVAEVPEGVDVALRAGRVQRGLAQLPLVAFLRRNKTDQCLVTTRVPKMGKVVLAS